MNTPEELARWQENDDTVTRLCCMEWHRKNNAAKKLIPALCARGIRPGLIKHTTMIWMLINRAKIAMSCARLGGTNHRCQPATMGLDDGNTREEELDLHFLASRMDTSKLDLFWSKGLSMKRSQRLCCFAMGRTSTGRISDRQACYCCSQ